MSRRYVLCRVDFSYLPSLIVLFFSPLFNCVKVHNGIEYGDLQLIAEVYDFMRSILKMSNEEIADVLFDEWNKGELSSYLVEITALILRKRDEETGKGYVVDYVLDKTGAKGTGKWTVQEAT